MTVPAGCRFQAFSFMLGAVTALMVVIAFRDNPPANAQKSAPKDADSSVVKLGANVAIGKRLFPDDNPWNQDISKEPVDPNSANLVASIGLDKPLHPDFGTFWAGAPNGIPYVVVSGSQAKVPVEFGYADESDPGPYPIPPDPPIEGGPKSKGDRHILILDRDNWKLYELGPAYPKGNGWKADAGAIFDLKSNDLRPASWTSADAAGLPILPGLVRYDEAVEKKAIEHALRFTVSKSRRGYVAPATHFASPHQDPNLPPMGMRVRLKADYDLSKFPPECQVILRAMQKYGMFVADNGGNWFLWRARSTLERRELRALKRVKGKDFEVVKMGTVVTK